MYRRGISPVIATVIIVAVAVAISIAVVGWLMGLWSSVAGGTEMIQITPIKIVNGTDGKVTVQFYVINKGTAPVEIIRVDVIGVGSALKNNISPSTIEANNTPIEVNANVSGNCTPGVSYVVKIYTSSGNVYQTNMMCYKEEQ